MIESEKIRGTSLVLVVDDQEINRDVLGMILEGDGYQVMYATDGIEAMDAIEANLDSLSIVMLDLIMPNMDGFEVIECMKSDKRMRHIPIIVLTAERKAELRALQMGAADFIVKPFDAPEIILARVARIIELVEGRQLISAAEHDRLTGLYNRSFFFEYANLMVRHQAGLAPDAVVLNIEQFHSVNALNGREFGDEVLRVIGDEIKGFLATTEGIASRFEADRFDIFCAPHDDYHPLLKAIQACLDARFADVNIHVRMGVNRWSEGVEPVAQFDRARAACNMVRGNYQDPLMVYNDEMLERELRNQRLLNDLRAAVDERQLMVFYQPKYDIQSEPARLCSAEALIRWRHPEFGMISPADFVPLFEGNGLIGVVDTFVWNEAVAQIARWRDELGYTLPVSVNVSRSDIFDPTLTERLERMLEDNGVDHSCLKLEITESAYTNNAKGLLLVIERLRESGFEIEMDDFGSGYSSLNMLSDMPIDVLKMDMKFIRNIEDSETDRRLVRLILDIAKYLHLTVVAEGVETEGQLALLKEWGCDLVQGYYFSRPLPADEFKSLMEREIAQEGGRT